MASIQFGLMIRGQFPQNEDMGTRFEEMVEQVRLVDRLGFNSVTKGMHYAQYPLQGLNQIVFLSRIAAESQRLRLNFGIILLALHKPLDIAEQLASLDVISKGRVIFGAALGYREVELAAFGVQRKEIVRRFTENIEAIKRLWTEDRVSMKGTFFELMEANVSVKPVQKPRPPIWIGANADPAIERAARIGDCWYVNPHNRMDTIQQQVEVYKRALDAAGKPFPAEFPGRRECFVARTRDEAIRLCRPYLAKKYEVYHAWGQDKAMPEGDNDLGLEFDELIKNRFFLGGPDEVAQQIIDYTRSTGINHHVLSCQWPGMPQSMVLDTLHLLAAEVFPKVRQGL
jgi:alkanesulfonate monooxygenase SsuD/methylene tetrahydromethanopterin reductase-like flavin-dependent oxidoreductase (luciferase family)